MAASDFNVFVGTELGLLKGLSLVSPSSPEDSDAEKCFLSKPLLNLDQSRGICRLCWKSPDECQLVVGCRNGSIQVFDLDKRSSDHVLSPVSQDAAVMVGLEVTEQQSPAAMLFAFKDGVVASWNGESEERKTVLDLGFRSDQKFLSRMRLHRSNEGVVVVAGKNVDVTVVDCVKACKSFEGKNKTCDKLGVALPLHVTDTRSVGESLLVSCTASGEVRVHDPRTQRRPVSHFFLESKDSLKSCSYDSAGGFTVMAQLPEKEEQFVLGSRNGDLAIVDLKRKGLLRRLQGHNGSVRDICCHPRLPIVASVGLDRFLHVHDLTGGSKEVSKMYLSTSMESILLSGKHLTLEQIVGQFGAPIGRKVQAAKSISGSKSAKSPKMSALADDDEGSASYLECFLELAENVKGEEKKQPVLRHLCYGSHIRETNSIPDPLEFYREFVAKNCPLVLRGVFREWQAVKQWDLDWFRRSPLGEKDVTVAVTPSGYADAIDEPSGLFMLPEERRMKLKEFLDILDHPEESSGVFYIQKQNSNLTDEFESLVLEESADPTHTAGVPPEISWFSESLGRSPDAVNLWIGDGRAIADQCTACLTGLQKSLLSMFKCELHFPEEFESQKDLECLVMNLTLGRCTSRLKVHKDHYENLYLVVRGCKKILLFPPTDVAWFPMSQVSQAKWQWDATTSTFQAVPCEDSDHKIPWIRLDPLVSVPKESSPIEVTLNAGDALYLPSLWFHHLRQSHGCVAVNYWWVANDKMPHSQVSRPPGQERQTRSSSRRSVTTSTRSRRHNGLSPENEGLPEESDSSDEGSDELSLDVSDSDGSEDAFMSRRRLLRALVAAELLSSEDSDDSEAFAEVDKEEEEDPGPRSLVLKKSLETREQNMRKYIQKMESLQREKEKEEKDLKVRTVRQKVSFIRAYQDYRRGILDGGTFQKNCVSLVKKELQHYEVAASPSLFHRRITAMVWHPVHSDVLAMGAKNGQVVIWNWKKDIEGTGRKFDYVATPSHCPWEEIPYLITSENPYEVWYTALDVSDPHSLCSIGTNKGFLHWFDSRRDSPVQLDQFKLHKTKISHIEFSKVSSHLMATASIDKTVAIWDVRHMDRLKPTALYSLTHDKPVNKAHFSAVSNRLLTTDQHSQVRIYSDEPFNLEHVICHPHRQFQHLTPIKASWHPLIDIFCIGRYPDPKIPGFQLGDLKSVDFFDGYTGKEIHRLTSPGAANIMSLNEFDPRGEVLASAMIVLQEFDDEQETTNNASSESTTSTSFTTSTPSSSHSYVPLSIGFALIGICSGFAILTNIIRVRSWTHFLNGLARYDQDHKAELYGEKQKRSLRRVLPKAVLGYLLVLSASLGSEFLPTTFLETGFSDSITLLGVLPMIHASSLDLLIIYSVKIIEVFFASNLRSLECLLRKSYPFQGSEDQEDIFKILDDEKKIPSSSDKIQAFKSPLSERQALKLIYVHKERHRTLTLLTVKLSTATHPSLLFLHFSTIAAVVMYTYTMTSMLMHNSADPKTIVQLALGLVTSIIRHMTIIRSTASLESGVHEAVQNLFRQLHPDVPASVSRDVFQFLTQISTYPPQINASGYVTWNKTVITSGVSTVFTYLVVLLQMEIEGLVGM
ncbi:unnamed protein product [Cyprideis torosa]|uniref:DNA damage-binding protein 2 n=1 Tax=Cyprideis torosa TaxID=163714 RepID=A0A7R8WBY9_9CRUS|nr:unnamed protein product [Cyprideis torosa]CAG0887506.1 unnamed protein product [Cyprideis torosa]